MPKGGKKFAKKKSILDTVKDTLAKRENPRDPRSRVGRGGRDRASRIDAAVEGAQTGRMKEGQSTDSSQ